MLAPQQRRCSSELPVTSTRASGWGERRHGATMRLPRRRLALARFSLAPSRFHDLQLPPLPRSRRASLHHVRRPLCFARDRRVDGAPQRPVDSRPHAACPRDRCPTGPPMACRPCSFPYQRAGRRGRRFPSGLRCVLHRRDDDRATCHRAVRWPHLGPYSQLSSELWGRRPHGSSCLWGSFAAGVARSIHAR